MGIIEIVSAAICLIAIFCAVVYNNSEKLDKYPKMVGYCAQYVMAYATIKAGLESYGFLFN